VLKSFAGGQVFGGAWGEGPATVLALHGWQRTHADFTPVFAPKPGEPTPPDPVAPSAVALDLFGFGATPAPPEPWGSAEYASHLVPLFEEPGVLADRIVLVGHSLGGRVAVHLANLVPDRIERLVLIGAPLLHRQGRRSRPVPAYRAIRRLHRMGLIDDARMEAARNRYGSRDYRAAQGALRPIFVGLLAESYTDQMAAVTCPVDLVWGEDDTEVPLEVAERAEALFPRSPRTRLITLPGTGHLVPTEAPAALGALIAGQPAETTEPAQPAEPEAYP
jgi:pimeloyl-ACP methyl ester carboxylesterase